MKKYKLVRVLFAPVVVFTLELINHLTPDAWHFLFLAQIANLVVIGVICSKWKMDKLKVFFTSLVWGTLTSFVWAYHYSLLENKAHRLKVSFLVSLMLPFGFFA